MIEEKTLNAGRGVIYYAGLVMFFGVTTNEYDGGGITLFTTHGFWFLLPRLLYL